MLKCFLGNNFEEIQLFKIVTTPALQPYIIKYVKTSKSVLFLFTSRLDLTPPDAEIDYLFRTKVM